MAKFAHQDSRRMYSWWWDSHISPKNSKWLQENLTDMDVKVKSMIKLIEEDADSFARRAEMYYKKRPELMKMVEDFYRAYRALAERYDHATGVIRHAHRRMTEAQLPMMFSDDPRSPDMSMLSGDFTDDSDSAIKRKSFGMVEKVRRGLNFDEVEEKEQSNGNNHVKEIHHGDSEEIIVLKEALAKMEAEKEAGLVQYQQSLDKLSQLEAEISKTREDFRVLNDHANRAENEAVVLKEKLAELEAEKKSKLDEYQKRVDQISNLQADTEKLNERADSAETEAQKLQGELDKLVVEKDATLNQYMQSLDTISSLESKLQLTEEDARRLKERAEKAESEVEILRETISKLMEEKEAASLQYEKCLKTISDLEHKLASAEEESKRLNLEIENGVSKMKGAEEQCLLLERANQSLHSELESLMLKMGNQTQELTEKQKELGRLWACIQEERLRFVEAETAFQTLQHLHAQTQEELQSMASELQNRAQLLNVAERQNQSLQDEVVKVKQDNKHLDEINASSALSIKNMQNEISSLMESKGKLQEEVELRLDQRNALQQEIYCLKEELSDLNKNHLSILDQVREVGLNPESLGSSVKQLQEENLSLKETCSRESGEKAALLEKMLILEQLREKNSLLETSLSDLNAELEAVRGKIEALEQSCKSLLSEKSVLVDEKATLAKQLEDTKENLEKLSQNNTVLENSLSDAHRQLESLKAKSKILEDSCQLLVNEKAGLISEKEGLEKLYGELEGSCMLLEKEKESTLRRVEELQVSLDVERQEHAGYIQKSEARFGDVEAKMHVLHEECQHRKRELDQVLDNAIDNEIEIFVLRATAEQLKESNCALVTENLKLLEESRLSEEKIVQLEHHNSKQQVEIKSLSDLTSSLRAGTGKLLKVLDIVEDFRCEDKSEQDQAYVNQLLSKIHDLKKSLFKAEEENLGSTVELSVLVTLIRQLRLAALNLEVEKNKIEHDFKVSSEQIAKLESNVASLLGMNEELRLKLREGDFTKEAMVIQIEDLSKKLMDMEASCQVLQREKFEISEQKRLLMDNVLHLEEKNNVLEEENYVLFDKVLDLENVSLVFRSFADEKVKVLREVGDDRSKLNEMNHALMGKLSLTEGKLDETRTQNLDLKERLQRTEDDLKIVAIVKDQLSSEIENGKKLLQQMELQLQEAEEKINNVEKEKLKLNGTVEDMRTEYEEAKMANDDQKNEILKLSADKDNLSSENNCLHETIQKQDVELLELQGEVKTSKIQEENLENELRKKINEINELETRAVSVFGQLQYSMVSQILYEQKFNELHDTCLGYMDENEGLKSQLAAYGPEIASLKESISSLENHADIHIKFQNPENDELKDSQVADGPCETSLSDLHDQRIKLQAIAKAAIEMKELMVQENIALHSKLDASLKQLELLQSENGQYYNKRSTRPTSEITEENNTLLTKDIVLDQISDGSSYGYSKRREPAEVDSQTLEVWETSDPAAITVGSPAGITVSKSKRISSDVRRVRSMRKQKDLSVIEKDLSVDKLEVSKRSTESLQEGNKRKVLERLDSDVQKLANLQITVQDLKRKLNVTEEGKRGKAVIECEALKGQLEEADTAIMKLFELNGRLMKSIDADMSFSDINSSSFDLEGEGGTRKRRVSEQARRMSEKIGRLQLEVQKLQFVLLKLDDGKEGKEKMSESKRRVLLRDYLYGAGRNGQRRKRGHFCACVQPSTKE